MDKMKALIKMFFKYFIDTIFLLYLVFKYKRHEIVLFKQTVFLIKENLYSKTEMINFATEITSKIYRVIAETSFLCDVFKDKVVIMLEENSLYKYKINDKSTIVRIVRLHLNLNMLDSINFQELLLKIYNHEPGHMPIE